MALGLTEVNNRRRSPQKKDIKGEKSPDEWQGVGQASTGQTNNSGAVREQFGSSSEATPVPEALPGVGASSALGASTDSASQDGNGKSATNSSEAIREQFGSSSETTLGSAALPELGTSNAPDASTKPPEDTTTNNSEAVREHSGSSSEATPGSEALSESGAASVPGSSIDPAVFRNVNGNTPANNSEAVREQSGSNSSAARSLTRSSPLRSGAASKEAVPSGDYWNVSELSKKVLQLIGEHCDEHMGRICRPLTNKYIAKIVGSTEDCVKVTLRRLEKVGCIVRMKSKSGPQGWTVYQIPAAIFAAMQEDKDG